MIITCPSCATRYDVDDRRFSPEGRSVRCAECEESWFVPALQPIEDLVPLNKKSRVYAEDEARERPESIRETHDYREKAVDDEPVEEPLFDAAPRDDRKTQADGGSGGARDDKRDRRSNEDEDDAKNGRRGFEPPPLVRDRKGRFVKVKNTEKEQKSAPSFENDREDDRGDDRSRRRSNADRGRDDRRFGKAGTADDDTADRGRSRRDFRDENEGSGRDDRSRAELRADRKSRETPVVDADFEDINALREDYIDDPYSRGFGRKVREERRRETALVRLEDLEPVAERIFNEEFFTALRVQPKELERAIRKARRRAEARDKNRMTPLRAIGWSAWVGAITACAFVAYSYRNNIVAMFPNAKTAYEAVGIEANPYGLKIEGVTHRVAMSPQGPVIEILGRLRNEEAADVAPPMLQAEALGADGAVLSRWTFTAQTTKVRAGQSADFSTRAAAPDGVSEVLLSFAPAEGVKVSVGDLMKTPN